MSDRDLFDLMTQSPLERLARARKSLPTPEVRRAIREAAGVSQPEMAKALGVSTATVSRWESGLVVPSSSIVVDYVDALNMLARVETETR